MPTINQKKSGGWYIRTRIEGSMVTYQVSPSCEHWLKSHGYEPHDEIDRSLVVPLVQEGGLYTLGSGPGEEQSFSSVNYLESIDRDPLASEPARVQKSDFVSGFKKSFGLTFVVLLVAVLFLLLVDLLVL